ncbi:MAG: hypothetical protein ACMG6E_06160, partial [Candidatus Roizmanbacteria bacterium]
NPSSFKINNKHHKALQKKLQSCQQMQPEGEQMIESKLEFSTREDKSLSLGVILKREIDYQNELGDCSNAEAANEMELYFDKNEKENQIPDDYNYFLQKNESRLESPFHSNTQTLYEWIHICCSSWIPGPLVTPKTPVRLNKFDDKRFSLQCIICLKRDGACMQC